MMFWVKFFLGESEVAFALGRFGQGSHFVRQLSIRNSLPSLAFEVLTAGPS